MPDHTYVFVGGLHRSGTSLLARSLEAHPSVSGFRGWPLACSIRRCSFVPSVSVIVTSENLFGRLSRVVCSGCTNMRTRGISACTSSRRTRSSANCASPTVRSRSATATQYCIENFPCSPVCA